VKMSITMKNGIRIPFTRPEIYIQVHRKISPKYPFKPVAGHAQKRWIHPTTQNLKVIEKSLLGCLPRSEAVFSIYKVQVTH
jgi:hypothetical protein